MMGITNIRPSPEKEGIRMKILRAVCWALNVHPSITLYGRFECDFLAKGPMYISVVDCDDPRWGPYMEVRERERQSLEAQG